MDFLDEIVAAMKDVPKVSEMAPAVGVSWEDIKEVIHRHEFKSIRPQNIVNFIMLGAAIGYLFASGKKVGNDLSTH